MKIKRKGETIWCCWCENRQIRNIICNQIIKKYQRPTEIQKTSKTATVKIYLVCITHHQNEKNYPGNKNKWKIVYSPLCCIRRGEEKNETENGNAPRFYGPPSNCDELGLLGYTLNGYYWVKGKNRVSSSNIEIILCRFKKPHGSKDGKYKFRNAMIMKKIFINIHQY